MPLISMVRFITALLSFVLLGFIAYLLWSWYQGATVRDSAGVVHFVREDWRLWTSLALIAFSLLGKFLVVPLVAKPDNGEPTRAVRGNGRTIPGSAGASLYVEEHGPSGAPIIVFTHGWALDSTIWSYVKRDFGSRFRLILWDLPGLGRSKASTGEAINLEAFAADLRTVITLAGGAPVVLVGHSIGGMTIQTLARNNPELFGREIAGVVLVNTTYTNPLKTMILSGLAQALRFPLIEPVMRLTILLQPLAWLSAWQSYLNGTSHLANRIGFGTHVTRSQLEHVTLLATRNSPANIQRGNLAMFRWDATTALSGLPVPVLVLGGVLDIVTKPEASTVIDGEASQSRLQLIEGANHMGFLERPDVYNARIAEFVDQVSGSV